MYNAIINYKLNKNRVDMKIKTLQDFDNSKQFINYLTIQLSKGNSKPAGSLFEDFTREYHLEFGDYIQVYDSNDIDNIPDVILDKLDAWDLLDKGANSYGIDKICVTRHNEIDIHQDKSTLHTDKNISAKKAEAMMSLRDNPLKNVRNFILNTTAQNISHYKEVWKDQPPITFGFDSFVPDQTDLDAVSKDKKFWKNIKTRAKGKSTVKVYGFESRGPAQDEYIEAGVKECTIQITKNGYAKWHQLAVGAVGKSVLDPVLLTELEDLFDPLLTNTPQPVSVGFWHSSKTLPANGWEFVQRRRAKGIYDEVIIVSGTNVIDGESESNDDRFPRTTNIADAVVKIKEALDNNKSVLLIALYHRAEQIQRIKTHLSWYYKGFKFWFRYRDECDWPCSNVHSSFSPALDIRTDSVITFGSSGTTRLGKDPIIDYGLNNVQIHGPCAYTYTWKQAEDEKLVKPLILILPSVKESEIAYLFPQFVNKDGRVDWNMKVDGISVDNDYPTVGLIADMICYIRSLVEYPEIQRTLMFANRVKKNKLAEVNFCWVANKILGNSKQEKAVKEMFFLTLRDDKYNTLTLSDKVSIKKAKKHTRYTIGSSKVFSRGYNDTSSPKHHASIHWDPKGEVNFCQEIWRTNRLDNDKWGNPIGGDPFSYLICPQIINDLDDKPNWSEERTNKLLHIIRHNKNVSEEFESEYQKSGSKRKKAKRKGRIWIPENFDITTYNNLVNFVALNSRGNAHESLTVRAHSWLLKEYMKLSPNDLVNPKGRKHINEKWLTLPEFTPLFNEYKLYKSSPRTFREAFWACGYLYHISEHARLTCEQNLIEYKLHVEKIRENKSVKIKQAERDFEKLVKNCLHDDSNYRRGFTNDLCEKYGLKTHWISPKPIIEKWAKNNAHWDNQKRKVYKIMFEEAEENIGSDEWFKRITNRWTETKIIGCKFYGRIPHRLLQNYWNVLNAKEYKELKELQKLVNASGYHGNHRIWNTGLTKETDERLAGIGQKHKKLWADPKFVAKEMKRRKNVGARESFRENCREAQQNRQKSKQAEKG